MIGAIIGDIVGSRFEFNNLKSKKFDLFTENSEFTDDSVCTVAVADFLMAANEYGIVFPERFIWILRRWCRRYPDLSYGSSFNRWIHSKDPAPYNSFGNGAAMRISPVGLFGDDFDYTVRMSDLVTGVTHNHPEGLKGARAVSTAIAGAMNGMSKKEIKELVVSRFEYDLSMSVDEIREMNVFDETCQVTVPQAFACFLESSDFEDAIRLAVSIGGDSDTIAAIVGGLAEAFYKKIPSSMINGALRLLPRDMYNVVIKFYAYTSSLRDHYKKL